MEIDKKISDLSTIPEWAIKRLHEYTDLIHSNDIINGLKEKEQVISIDILEGKLYIKIEDDNIKYKFVPSKEFNELVKNTIINKEDKLLTAVSAKLKQALMVTYKDIL